MRFFALPFALGHDFKLTECTFVRPSVRPRISAKRIQKLSILCNIKGSKTPYQINQSRINNIHIVHPIVNLNNDHTTFLLKNELSLIRFFAPVTRKMFETNWFV